MAMSELLLADETRRYFESHPSVADRIRRAEKVFKVFGGYLNLTQSRLIIRESGGCNTEVDANAAVSRTDT